MPLFSGVPFFNVTPDATNDPTRLGTGRSLALGLDRAFQNRQFNANLAEKQRQFDLTLAQRQNQFNEISPYRDIQLQQARAGLLQQQNELNDAQALSDYMVRIRQDPNATPPKLSTVKYLETLANFRKAEAEKRFEIGNKNSMTEFMNLTEELNNVDKSEVIGFMVKEGGPTSPAWQLLYEKIGRTPDTGVDGLTTGAQTALQSAAIKLEAKGFDVMEKDATGRPTGRVNLERIRDATDKLQQSEAVDQLSKAKLEAEKIKLRSELEAVDDAANNVLIKEFRDSSGNVDNDKVRAAKDQVMKNYLQRVSEIINETSTLPDNQPTEPPPAETPPQALINSLEDLFSFEALDAAAQSTLRTNTLEAPVPQLQPATTNTADLVWDPKTRTFKPAQ